MSERALAVTAMPEHLAVTAMPEHPLQVFLTERLTMSDQYTGPCVVRYRVRDAAGQLLATAEVLGTDCGDCVVATETSSTTMTLQAEGVIARVEFLWPRLTTWKVSNIQDRFLGERIGGERSVVLHLVSGQRIVHFEDRGRP